MLACVGAGIVIPAASGRIGPGIIADGGHGHHQAICIGRPFEIPELFELIIGLIAPVQYHDEAMLPIGQSTIGRENPCRVPRDYILRGRVPIRERCLGGQENSRQNEKPRELCAVRWHLFKSPNPNHARRTSEPLADISQMIGDWTVKLSLLGRFGALRHRHLRS